VEQSRPRVPAEGEKRVPGGKAEDTQGMRGFPSRPFNGRVHPEAAAGGNARGPETGRGTGTGRRETGTLQTAPRKAEESPPGKGLTADPHLAATPDLPQLECLHKFNQSRSKQINQFL